MGMKLYKAIARAIGSRNRCLSKSVGHEAILNWEEQIRKFNDMLPSGSGFDCGTKINLDESNSNKIVINTSFHHMDENGGYNGWTNHAITIRAELEMDFTLRVSGRDKNQIKEYIAETFNHDLMQDVDVK